MGETLTDFLARKLGLPTSQEEAISHSRRELATDVPALQALQDHTGKAVIADSAPIVSMVGGVPVPMFIAGCSVVKDGSAIETLNNVAHAQCNPEDMAKLLADRIGRNHQVVHDASPGDQAPSPPSVPRGAPGAKIQGRQ